MTEETEEVGSNDMAGNEPLLPIVEIVTTCTPEVLKKFAEMSHGNDLLFRLAGTNIGVGLSWTEGDQPEAHFLRVYR